jgi:DNA-binding FadR family transcriptional regulator
MRLAIVKYEESELEKLREKLDILREEIAKGPENVENVFIADNVFHDTVSEMGHNPIVDRINNVVREMTHKMRYLSVKNMLESGRGEELYEAHETIYRKIRERDDTNLNRDIRRTYFPEEAEME